MSAEPHAAHDDFIQFCTGVRRLTGIDLTQYKRRQMERRMRTFADRARARPGRLPRRCSSGEPGRAERVPGPGHDQRLRSSGATPSSGRRSPRSSPTLAETGTVQSMERRLLVRRRGLHAGRDRPRGRAAGPARDPRDRHRPAHGRPRPRGPLHDRRRPHARRRRSSRSWFDREPRRLARQAGAAAADAVRHRRPPERPRPAGRFDLVLCRNVVIYFTEPVRDALHHRLVESLRPGGYLMVGSSERVAEPRAIGLECPAPFIYRKAA